jgi:hypothetical protein
MNELKQPKDILTQFGINIDPKSLITEDEKNAIRTAEIKAAKMERAKTRLETLGAPKRLILGRSRTDWSGTWGEKARIMKTKIGTGTILVFRGPPGTGKTQMACELLIHAITELDLSAKFSSYTDMQLAIKGSFGRTGGEQSIIESMTKPSVLVIDEFDWAPTKRDKVTDDYWQGIIYHIINHRYGDMQDTILTSNKSEAEFADTTISPIKSRIMECGGVVSTDGWTDWRVR